MRANPGVVENAVRNNARRDGVGVPVWVEQERGAAGKTLLWQFQNRVLPGYHVRGRYVTGTKETNAKLLASLITPGHFYVVAGEWVPDFLAECGAFPEGDHDDQVDSVSSGILCLEREAAIKGGGVVTRRGGKKGRRGRKPRKRKPDPLVSGHVGY